jgi:membrane protein
VRLPAVDVPRRVMVKGVLFAAVSFEVLKIVGTYTIAASAHSATAGPFAGTLAILIWIQLVSRVMLFSCAWTAVLTREANEHTQALPYRPVRREPVELITREARLVGAGAAAGGFLVWVLIRSRDAIRPSRFGASPPVRPTSRTPAR